MSRILLLVLIAAAVAPAEPPKYLGPETCALCHREIAQRQNQTAMANTWQSTRTSWLPPLFQASVPDDPSYTVQRDQQSFRYALRFAGRDVTLPVGMLVGGRRHGLGFLLPMKEWDGVPLARPVLVQARHAWSMDRKLLLLAPGCALGQPTTVESALGIALSPTFESRCLACHGQPDASGAPGRSGGVHCESCHGPGAGHLKQAHDIVNPARLSNEQRIEVCARCHQGLTRFSDPSPGDLLVANQTIAIQRSECYLQSGKAFSCITCHDPHADSSNDHQAVKACLNCHAASAKPHAAICPVNASSGCIGCHMPSVEMGPLHLVDHWIRVHPEQGVTPPPQRPEWASQVRPVSEYLRVIVTGSAAQAEAAQDDLRKNQSFYQVARQRSKDASSSIGGYWGRRNLANLPPSMSEAVARLSYGATSAVIQEGPRWFIVQRMPRDFHTQAEQLQTQAETLALQGNGLEAIQTAQRALMLYPHFLRSLSFIGVTFAQGGNPRRGAEVLAAAARLYPEDAAIQFELGAVHEMQADNNGAAAAYRRALALDGDLTAGYLKLGLLACASHDWKEAIREFRAGLQIDPLAAGLYRGLAVALEQTGDLSGARENELLASKLEPSVPSAASLPLK